MRARRKAKGNALKRQCRAAWQRLTVAYFYGRGSDQWASLQSAGQVYFPLWPGWNPSVPVVVSMHIGGDDA